MRPAAGVVATAPTVAGAEDNTAAGAAAVAAPDEGTAAGYIDGTAQMRSPWLRALGETLVLSSWSLVGRGARRILGTALAVQGWFRGDSDGTEAVDRRLSQSNRPMRCCDGDCSRLLKRTGLVQRAADNGQERDCKRENGPNGY